MTLTEHTMLPLDIGDIHVCQDGPRDAPALLLIHGSAASTTSWTSLVPLLATTHHVIRIDLPGHGRSAKPIGHAYETADQARTAAAALEQLGVDQATLVGHSSGGYTATALAEQRPELVTALVLVNTGPGLDAFTAPSTDPIGPEQWPPSDEQIRQIASSGFREGFHVPQEFIDEVREMPYHAFVATFQASTQYLLQQTLPERLKAVGKPLQVIFGDQDRRWSPSSAQDYKAVPGVRIDMVPNAGHTPILEDPSRTAELLLSFAARLN